jgi:peptide-methionine (S)-S-oxide reductase
MAAQGVEPLNLRAHIRLMRHVLMCLLLLISPAALAQKAGPAKTEQAVFAGGCFWCMETDMQGSVGVLKVESGYTGGALRNPSYEDVLTEKTGHYEAVRVTYDPAKVTYPQLLSKYWKLIDPTDDGGQFCDRGPSYRSAVFVTPQQKADAEASRQKLIDSKKLSKPVVTPVLPLGDFWPAEAYHRDFAKRNPDRYASYRKGCGRDAVLRRVWKLDPEGLPH